MKTKTMMILILLATILFVSCSSGSNKIAPITLYPYEVSGGDEGYFDPEGKIAINPQFRYTSIFRDGLALVGQKSDSWGYIDKEGKYLINSQFKEATTFSEGLPSVVSENSAPTAIDKNGEIKFAVQAAENAKIFSDGMAAYSISNEEGDKIWGFVDKKGTTVIQPQFSEVDYFSEGKCAVSNNEGKWGYIDKKGTLIINHQFTEARDFSNGMAVVEFNDKYGVIDGKGAYIINPQFEKMFSDGDVFLMAQGGKYGWCDNKGKIVINPQFNSALPFSGDDLAPVEVGTKVGYVNKKGEIVINPQFDEALPFNNGKGLVAIGGKYGLIDKKGKYIVNPQFEDCPDDLSMYLVFGLSDYDAVETDFFDVNAVTGIISLDNPEGISLSLTYAEILQKLNLKDSDLGKLSNEHRIITDKHINRNASYNFYILGKPWETKTITKKTNYYGYAYNTSSNVTEFASNKLPDGYAYEIELDKSGYGKGKTLAKAIETLLSSYTKDTEESTEDDMYFKNGSQEVNLFYDDSEVVLVIKRIVADKS